MLSHRVLRVHHIGVKLQSKSPQASCWCRPICNFKLLPHFFSSLAINKAPWISSCMMLNMVKHAVLFEPCVVGFHVKILLGIISLKWLIRLNHWICQCFHDFLFIEQILNFSLPSVVIDPIKFLSSVEICNYFFSCHFSSIMLIWYPFLHSKSN